jgi:hypothetical protein
MKWWEYGDSCSLQLLHCLCYEFCALSAASKCTNQPQDNEERRGGKLRSDVNWQEALKQKRHKIRSSHIVLKISVVLWLCSLMYWEKFPTSGDRIYNTGRNGKSIFV